MRRAWTGHVFLGTSVDGFIARPGGELDWLTSRGEAAGDGGFRAFQARMDHMVMGRVTYRTVVDLGAWPYDGTSVLVLSSTLDEGGDARIRVVRSLEEACAVLEDAGARNVYLDGGRVVRSSLAAGLVDELVLTCVPVLIGQGVSAFGPLPRDVELEHLSTAVLPGGLVQSGYRVLHGPAARTTAGRDR